MAPTDENLRVDVWINAQRLDPSVPIDLGSLIRTGALIVVSVPDPAAVGMVQERVTRRVCEALGISPENGIPYRKEES